MKKKQFILSFLILLLFARIVPAQEDRARAILRLNENWQFTKENLADVNASWQRVDLPHTWNIEDVMDDEPGYYRGIAWYKKEIFLDNDMMNRELSLYFEGVNQEATVFINGKKAGYHAGGYTGFEIAISPFLQFDGKQNKNEIWVKADNSFNNSIPPLSADFTFYGGIYRDVFLVSTGKVHFDRKDKGSCGVYLTTPSVSAREANVKIKALVSNQTKTNQNLKIFTVVRNREGKPVGEVSTPFIIKAGGSAEVQQEIHSIKQPRLWSPADPYLYKAETTVRDASGKILDIHNNPLGFRWFSFDAEKGFFLNGISCKLVGASRHQDYKGKGNAVPDELAINDILWLKKMGANFLRVAHYPQDPSVMNACDSLGIMTSVEIPIVNEITESDSFYRHSEQMQVEMIRQNFNHPSVLLWCYMNEVLLRPHFPNDKERQKLYFANIRKLAQRLEDITRKEDPYRYTFMANHGDLNKYKAAGLLSIPMVVGWNLYSGWYGGTITDFPLFLDNFHNAYPHKPMMVTEYGADADPRIRSLKPVRFDKSVEYTTSFHQYYLEEMMKRSFVAGAIAWNLADFNSETRTETMPHINNKGLMEWDRTPKDPYYFYQAILSREPFIKILGSHKLRRTATDSIPSVCYQLLQVASNLDSVTLSLNGEAQASRKVSNGICEWVLPFQDGVNIISVRGQQNGNICADYDTVDMQLQTRVLGQTQFRQMNVVMGTNRYYTDKEGLLWQPDQTYEPGGWGHVGGKTFRLESNSRLPYGTDKDIYATSDDPLFQTQQTGIEQYKLDVPAGEYELKLYFAELIGGSVPPVPYNLEPEGRKEEYEKRVFNVRVNGQLVLHDFNIAKETGFSTATTKSVKVNVPGIEGISIQFEAIKGEPVLNALQVVQLSGATTYKK